MEEKNEEVVVEETSTNAVEKYFGVKKYGSTVKTEIMAGVVTFLTMCYILILNPNILVVFNSYIGVNPGIWSSVFIATALGAVIGTLFMALFAKMPLAQAPGLGLNSMVAGLLTVIPLVGLAPGSFTLANGLALVLISGILFLVVSVVPIGKTEDGKFVTLREKVFDGMPLCIRQAISVGIGLFIAFIGMQNASIIVDSATLVTFVDLTKLFTEQGQAARTAIVGIVSFILIAILSHYKVKGAVIIGILVSTVLAIPLGVANVEILAGKGSSSWAFWQNFTNYFKSEAEGGAAFIALTEGFKFPEGSVMTCIMTVIAFCMIDMFDTMGTTVGCAQNAGLVDESGKPLNYNKIMISDSVATCIGACLGTSTVTTFVESGSGIAAGGKTGLTALVVAILFFLSLFILPIFEFIPTAACAGALMYVGLLMFSNVKNIDLHTPLKAIPAFATIIFMPLTYSITNGIGIGIIVYVIMHAVVYLVEFIQYKLGKKEEAPKWEISIVCLVIFVLFAVYFFVPKVF